MTDREPGESPARSPAEPDADEPIDMLADYGEEPTTALLDRVRSSIERRDLTSQIADLFWNMPLKVLLEYLALAFGFSSRENRSKGEQE